MSEVVRQATAFLVEKHKIKHIVLLAHIDCGYYKSKYFSHDKERIRKQQIDDLKKAKTLLSGRNVDVMVEAYFAIVENNEIEFVKIEG